MALSAETDLSSHDAEHIIHIFSNTQHIDALLRNVFYYQYFSLAIAILALRTSSSTADDIITPRRALVSYTTDAMIKALILFEDYRCSKGISIAARQLHILKFLDKAETFLDTCSLLSDIFEKMRCLIYHYFYQRCQSLAHWRRQFH